MHKRLKKMKYNQVGFLLLRDDKLVWDRVHVDEVY